MQVRLVSPGALAALPDLVARLARPGPVAVIAGPSSFTASGSAAALEGLAARARILTVPGRLPRLEEIERLRSGLGGTPPGCLVAIGGGRVLDTAKLLSTAAPADAIAASLASGRPLPRRLPLIAVPTTAGSGSESTPFAVVYAAGRKHSLDHPSLLPDAALVDAALLASLPPSVAASAGLDALCQAIEALLSRGARPASDRLARHALSLAAASLVPAVRGGAPARRRMALAANLAGRAIAETRTTIPHALSYTLTHDHGIAHGHAVALSMGGYLAAFGRALPVQTEIARWRAGHSDVLAALGARGPDDVAGRWRALVTACGLAPDLAGCGLGAAAARAAAAAVDPARLGNAPLALDRAALAALFA